MTRVPTPTPPAQVALREVERELNRRLRLTQGPGESPVVRACMSNLIIYSDTPELAAKVAAAVPAVVAQHPARVLLLIAEQGTGTGSVTATVSVRGHVVEPGRWIVSEQITLRAVGQAIDRLPYAVRGLLIGDLPTNLWWAPAAPPPLGGALLYELSERAQQVIYDSIGWTEPARGVVSTAAWLARFERHPAEGPWRVASDLNWRRLKYWRRLLAQALDPKVTPGALESITEVRVQHGPHAVVQAWELVSWMASRLGWTVRLGQVQPGVEITWQVAAPHGAVKVCIHRLPDGPSEVRRVRIACQLDGKPAALNAVVQDERRLAVMPEGVPGVARTVTVQPQDVPELLARQLSDRDRDPVFRESMAVAEVLARSVLR
ncbi:MAG: glucose-6-phosphate dehydrogenase assembly protein OpcA [Gemmataceae bacterium]|nr:glucose-6-phosphate dehydrogenase assembly protein OpcA [Gemmataceae bacterium]